MQETKNDIHRYEKRVLCALNTHGRGNFPEEDKKLILNFNGIQFNKITKPTIDSLRRIMISTLDEIDYPCFSEILIILLFIGNF
jgi:hypothetical protein